MVIIHREVQVSMKFAEVIREAGFNPEYFPKCSKLSIILYDSKRRINTFQENIHFVEPLFKHSQTSRESFKAYLSYLEKGLTKGSIVKPSITVQISKDLVILDFQTPSSVILFRYDHSR